MRPNIILNIKYITHTQILIFSIIRLLILLLAMIKAKSSTNFGANSNEHVMYNNIAKYVLSVCDRYHVVTKVFIASLRADEPLGWCMSRAIPSEGK